MFKAVRTISFRSKILSVLLLNTFLLSIFSLILVHSIAQVSDVSSQMKNRKIPEVIWFSHWTEELNMKNYLAETYISSGDSMQFMKDYLVSEIDESGMPQLPDSLGRLNSKMNLLDFQIKNNVRGLIKYGDEEAARRFIQDEYLPQLKNVQKDISLERSNTFTSLQNEADKIPPIIRKSLWLLLLLTFAALIFSIYASYRISANLTQPIEKMVKKVNKIAGGQYGLTIPEIQQLELKHLTNSINKMSLRLNESFQRIIADKNYREQILNSLPVGIIIYHNETEDYILNTSAEKLLHTNAQNLSDMIKKKQVNNPFWELLFSSEICQNKKVPFQSAARNMVLLVSQSQLVDDKLNVIGRIFYFIDITETEEMEKRMHQSEKLALVGEIAAGAAHEIRNPLAVIHGFMSLMSASFTSEENEKYHMPLLMKEIERINVIIEDMLLQAKPGAPILKEHYLEDIIQEILPLIIRSHNTEEMRFIVELERIPLLVDAKQIKQVFHNLIRNSIESIHEKGKISFYSEIEDSSYQIYVRDNGPGISLAIQKSMFEPFATSKENGTGLGLTIVQRIIVNHNGSIKLLSTSSSGTTFLISLPLPKERKFGET
ncbi:sensor histidine kinase [Metabacillus sp. RGM 3146]|uniref:sensor histidine kinase n=1 Tax=Metabacillus sp. RGM 3146 TaxID=3401092 RepID=UPI003B9D5860